MRQRRHLGAMRDKRDKRYKSDKRDERGDISWRSSYAFMNDLLTPLINEIVN